MNKDSSFSTYHRNLQILATEMFRAYAKSTPNNNSESSYNLRNCYKACKCSASWLKFVKLSRTKIIPKVRIEVENLEIIVVFMFAIKK